MGSVDTTRYFEIQALADKKGAFQDGTQLDPEKCLRNALWLYQRCQRAYPEDSMRRGQSYGSLYCGPLGPLVYLRWRLAVALRRLNRREESERLLQEARQSVQEALAYLEPRRQSHHQSRVTLLESPWFGAKVMRCVLLHTAGEAPQALPEAKKVIAEMFEAATLSLGPGECEVLYGRAGVLSAIHFLRRQLHDESLGGQEARALTQHILDQGQEYAALRGRPGGLPLLWEWHGSMYLGAAHGLVGILQQILGLNLAELQALEADTSIPYLQLIQRTVDALDQFCWPSGNLDSSIKEHDTDRLVHWCHGAPGHVMLLAKAAVVFQEERYLIKAGQIAKEVIWPRGLLRKGVGLCHGMAGNAYALLSLVRSDPTFLDMARCFAHFALDHLGQLEMVPDRPHSLYEGLAGLASLWIDMAHPDEEALFPLYNF